MILNFTPNEILISDLMVLCNSLKIPTEFIATYTKINYLIKLVSPDCKKIKFWVRDKTPTKVQLAIDIVKASNQEGKLAQVEQLIKMGFITQENWESQDYELLDILDFAKELKIEYKPNEP